MVIWGRFFMQISEGVNKQAVLGYAGFPRWDSAVQSCETDTKFSCVGSERFDGRDASA